MTFSVWKCQSPHLVLQQLWCDAMGCGAGTACRNGWYVWAPLSDDLSSLLIRQTSPNVWWILTPPSAPTGSWLLFAVLGTSSRPSSSSCCLKDESDLPSTTPLAPSSLPLQKQQEETGEVIPDWLWQPLKRRKRRTGTQKRLVLLSHQAGADDQPQSPICNHTTLILPRIFPWVTCMCGLGVAGPWAHWWQLCAAWDCQMAAPYCCVACLC